MKDFRVYVEGPPIQQGSMKAFAFHRQNGRLGVSMVHNKGNVLSAWREKIRVSLVEKYPELTKAVEEGGYFKQYVPVIVRMTFYLNKPKSNHLDNPTNKKADLDKLVRAVNDALTGIIYHDDCQIVEIQQIKKWQSSSNPEGLELYVFNMDEARP